MKKIILIITLILTLFTINAVEDKNLESLYFNLDNNSETNKVSFQIKFDENLQNNDKFSLDIYLNDKFIETTCLQELNNNDNILYRKITCDVAKLGNGKYKFISKISRDNNIIYSDSLINFQNNNYFSYLKFEEINKTKTKITIFIEGNGKGKELTIESRIPKEVINSLNKENKNELIYSKKKYSIIKEDPLIAWNVEKAPNKIEYTINKKISNIDREKFNIEVKENKNFQYFKYLIIFFIVLIIGGLIKPILLKQKK